MVIQTNILAMNAGRQFGITTLEQKKSSEKLSSGFKINRAADDAAGLTISEKMRRQIRGLNQASDNAQDGISMVQTAEGALNEVHDMLHRMNELCVKAANDTLTYEDRTSIQAEIDEYEKGWKDYEDSLDGPDVLPEPLKRDGDNDGSGARSGIDKVKAAIEKTSAERSELGAVQNRLEHTIRNLDNVAENTTSAESAIRDTDMSSEMVKYSKSNIVAQVGQSMLAQANQSKQGVLNLLG